MRAIRIRCRQMLCHTESSVVVVAATETETMCVCNSVYYGFFEQVVMRTSPPVLRAGPTVSVPIPLLQQHH